MSEAVNGFGGSGLEPLSTLWPTVGATIGCGQSLIKVESLKSSLLKITNGGGPMSFDGRLLSGMSVLAAVVEAGSFSRAGEMLGLSASGVSRSVARLEERLGVRLLNRTTRTLHLTDEGLRL